jgi:hypothetical protein
MAMGLLVVHYVNYISSYSPWLMRRIAKYKTRMVFVFPLITALPFITPDDSYGRTNEIFCGLPSNTETQNIWAIAILHFWLWIVVFISCFRLIQTLYKALQLDVQLASKIFTTIGVYVLITMAAWLERTIPRILNLVDSKFHSPKITYFLLIYIVYSIAVIYAVLLFFDRKIVLVDYQTFFNSQRGDGENEEQSEEDLNGSQRNSATVVDWDDVENTLHRITERGSTGDIGAISTTGGRSSTGNRASLEFRQTNGNGGRLSTGENPNPMLNANGEVSTIPTVTSPGTGTGTGRSSLSKESAASVSTSASTVNMFGRRSYVGSVGSGASGPVDDGL